MTYVTLENGERERHHLPARIMLRPWASYQYVAYLAFVVMWIGLFGKAFFLRTCFFFFSLWAVFQAVAYVFGAVNSLGEGRAEEDNLNDSFDGQEVKKEK